MAGVAGNDYGGVVINAEQDDGNWIGSLKRFFETDLAFGVARYEWSGRCAVSLGDEKNPFLSWVRFLVHISYNDRGE